jgi:DNA-directed RNA polymerase subunit RPC12/RpoP
MPYSSLSEARIKKLNGTSLTLAQVNSIAAMADAIGSDGWAIAISNFKKSHHVEGGSWVKNSGEEKEFSDLIISKEDDKWKIVAISTAAFKDQEGQTFTTQCIDYDLKSAQHFQDYPEFRLFHKDGLGFGKVTKMRRVGPFAVDEGYAYDDVFSKQICEKILSSNDGKWRVSRGFYVQEISGGCPTCNEKLLLQQKHMIAGFRCPTCKSIHLSKGVLKDLHFLKARTFDVTVTDIPCVPFTGVGAYRENIIMEDFVMNKKELRAKLIEAGIDEEVVDEKLLTVNEKQLKELSDLPDAVLFKQFGEEEEEEVKPKKSKERSDEQTFVLDDEVLTTFAEIVKKEVGEQLKEQLENMEIEVADLDGFDVNLKELPQMTELLTAVKELSGKLDTLLESDKDRVTKMLDDMPRSGKLRIRRFKAQKPQDEGDEEDTTDEEEMDEEEVVGKKKVTKQMTEEGLVLGSDGDIAGSMTEFIFGNDGGK